MFICSFKTTKVKLAAGLLVAVAAVGLVVSGVVRSANPAVATAGGINLTAENSQQRVEFLHQFGWEVREDPVEVAEIIIPMEFNAVYESYNKLQVEQGFNLKDFGGKRVKRWTYTVTNYPGYDVDSDCIHANILVCDGKIIGGDICSVELNGFMHGFDMQSMPETTMGTTVPETTQVQETTAPAEQPETTVQSKKI